MKNSHLPSKNPKKGVRKDEKKVAILGAGITGLTAAYELTKKYPDAEIKIFDRSDRPGGVFATERVDGFLIEGGPDSLKSSSLLLSSLQRSLESMVR